MATGLVVATALGCHRSPVPDPVALDAAAPASSGGPTPCLSLSQVQPVIDQHRATIRHDCWERSPSPMAQVSVAVSLTIHGDGSPENVATSGDDMTVARCVENEVRAWQFPAAGCVQKTQFSFRFVRE